VRILLAEVIRLYPEAVRGPISRTLQDNSILRFNLPPFQVEWNAVVPGASFILSTAGGIPVSYNVVLPGLDPEEEWQFTKFDLALENLERITKFKPRPEYRSVRERPLLATLLMPTTMLLTPEDQQYAGYLATAIAATHLTQEG
jgi:hypothetical protein